MVTLMSEIILDKNDDGSLKWAHSSTCKLHNFNGGFEMSMAPLQKLMGPRILNIYIRA